jgi:hypothetical protein
MVEEECYYVENVGGGIDENIPSTSFPHMLSTTHVHIPSSAFVHVPFSYLSDIESVHLQVPNILDVDASQLLVIEAQAMSWRTHSRLSICWGFFSYQ